MRAFQIKNNQMKKYFTNTILFLLGILSFSCSDYLDVQPEDKYLESQVYSSEDGVNNILNGVYLNLAENNLYGSQLTLSTVEVLGQRYNLSNSSHTWYNEGHYLYEETSAKSNFEGIWSSAYEAILNLNSLIEGLEKYSTLTEDKESIVKGEAIALRAMLHFDLLRLFGPIYSVNSEALSIPYYDQAKAESNPALPASEVIKNILNDLMVAEGLLAEDPIIENGVVEDINYPFYSLRNLRLNYYGVKALQARVNLYAGNNQEALAASKSVIEATSSILPWTQATDVISGENKDKVFSKEIIFAVQNLSLYGRQTNLFASSLTDSKILAPNTKRLEQVYESNENDYRYNPSWMVPLDGSKSYRTFFKYADVPDKEQSFRFMQPLIRKTEMYYIAAEATTDNTMALEYLNTVRYNRGLSDLEEGVDIEAEIQKEYMKEFYGEGQLFFYYKRKNIDAIPDGNSTSSSRTISMGEENYVIPIPDSETKFQ